MSVSTTTDTTDTEGDAAQSGPSQLSLLFAKVNVSTTTDTTGTEGDAVQGGLGLVPKHDCRIKQASIDGDGCVWRIGEKIILRDLSREIVNFELQTLRFLKEHTAVPIPKIHLEWPDGGRYYVIQDRLPGKKLTDVWHSLCKDARLSVIMDISISIDEIRTIAREHMGSVRGEPIPATVLLEEDLAAAHRAGKIPYLSGGFTCLKELVAKMANTVGLTEMDMFEQFGVLVDSIGPVTLTHGNLCMDNIYVVPCPYTRSARLVGIDGWENSGYYPVWWEYVALQFSRHHSSPAEKNFRDLLSTHLTPFFKAADYWSAFLSLQGMYFAHQGDEGTTLQKTHSDDGSSESCTLQGTHSADGSYEGCTLQGTHSADESSEGCTRRDSHSADESSEDETA